MSTSYQKSEDTIPPTNPSVTGPTQINNSDLWPEIERQAIQDPKAQALLELKKLLGEELVLLKKEGEKFKSQLEDYQKSLKRTDNLLIGIVVVVSVAFITTISLVFFDLIKEKDIYLRYNDIYKNNADQNSEMNIQINNIENELQILRAKNSYLR
ncbi:MAG: hypothetical protein WC575_04440 [Patescibacteria group bacterium]